MSFIALNMDDCRLSNFFYETVSTFFFYCCCIYIACRLQNPFAKFEMKTKDIIHVYLELQKPNFAASVAPSFVLKH